jgi:hypothetical protein
MLIDAMAAMLQGASNAWMSRHQRDACELKCLESKRRSSTAYAHIAITIRRKSTHQGDADLRILT